MSGEDKTAKLSLCYPSKLYSFVHMTVMVSQIIHRFADPE
jgi:hypothetical protein